MHWMSARFLLVLAILLAASATSAQEQKVDLDKLEAQLEQLKQEEAAAAAAARKKEKARLASQRFVSTKDVVRDNRQDIVWSSSDNGSDIDWNGATSYCASKGSGWSLPTSAQAQSMFDSTGKYAQPRSGHGTVWTIKPATDLIQFSQGAGILWTSERDGSSSAFDVALTVGGRVSAPVSVSYIGRALCVRRRS